MRHDVVADRKLISAIMQIDTRDMPEAMRALLEELGCVVTIDEFDNVVGVKGDPKGAPVLIAHTDTVFDEPPDHVFSCGEYLVGMDGGLEQCGLGADDRAGCAGILQVLPFLDNVTVVLCAYEEYGCQGSGDIDLGWFKGANIMLQMDRRTSKVGQGDAIFHTNGIQIASGEFKVFCKGILSDYGYGFCHGSCTDVGELKQRGVVCSGFNLSIGYLREHTETEILHVPSYERACNLVLDLCHACQGHVFPYAYEPRCKSDRWVGYSHGRGYEGWNNHYYRKGTDTFGDRYSEGVHYDGEGGIDDLPGDKKPVSPEDFYYLDYCDHCGAHTQVCETETYDFLCADCVDRQNGNGYPVEIMENPDKKVVKVVKAGKVGKVKHWVNSKYQGKGKGKGRKGWK